MAAIRPGHSNRSACRAWAVSCPVSVRPSLLTTEGPARGAEVLDSAYPRVETILLGQNPQLQGCDAAHLARAGWPAPVRASAAAARSSLLLRHLPGLPFGRRCFCATPCAAATGLTAAHIHVNMAPSRACDRSRIRLQPPWHLAVKGPRKVGDARPTNASDGHRACLLPLPTGTSS